MIPSVYKCMHAYVLGDVDAECTELSCRAGDDGELASALMRVLLGQ